MKPEYIDFTIPGEPRGKGRPRFSRAGNYVRTYTPEQTASYENLIKVEYQNKYGSFIYDRETPLNMAVYAYYAIPKSTSKKRRKMMLEGEIRPMKKPDADNILKVIADALNGVAYPDDVQIVSVGVNRHYSEAPRVQVVIWENVCDTTET